MYTLFFDLPFLIEGLAEAKVFTSEDELKAYLQSKNSSIQKIEIAALGYYNKSVCKEEFREVWIWTADGSNELAGKIIQVEDMKKFFHTLNKWLKTMEERYPAEVVKIKELLSPLQE